MVINLSYLEDVKQTIYGCKLIIKGKAPRENEHQLTTQASVDQLS